MKTSKISNWCSRPYLQICWGQRIENCHQNAEIQKDDIICIYLDISYKVSRRKDISLEDHIIFLIQSDFIRSIYSISIIIKYGKCILRHKGLQLSSYDQKKYFYYSALFVLASYPLYIQYFITTSFMYSGYGSGYSSYGGSYGGMGAYGSMGSSYGSYGGYGSYGNMNRDNNNANPNQDPNRGNPNQNKRFIEEYFKMMGGLRSMVQIGFSMVAFADFSSRIWVSLKAAVSFLIRTSGKFGQKLVGLFQSKKIGEFWRRIMLISPNTKNSSSIQNKVMFLLRLIAVAVIAVSYSAKRRIEEESHQQKQQLLKQCNQAQQKELQATKQVSQNQVIFQKDGYF